MMEEKQQKKILNLDFVKNTVASARDLTITAYDKPLFQFAALHVQFDQKQFAKIKGIEKAIPASNEDFEELRELSRPVSVDGKLYLKDAVRNSILKTLRKREMANLLELGGMDDNNTVQRIFNQYILGEAPPLTEQNLDELVASFSITQWLKDTPIEIPSESEILTHIKFAEVLTPFRRLTKNFKGRDELLSQLSDYVDWLPKSTAFEKIGFFLRNVISWHDRPPLMITGIGGIGKSTLMAKFILNQVGFNTERRLPFIYLDFDRPGISIEDPIDLIYEALRQLSMQFPANSIFFEKVIDSIKREYYTSHSENISRRSDREYFYDQYLKENFDMLSKIDTPILIVFDSFEEVQTRFSEIVTADFFNFLREISEKIPRLRTVFISRSDFGIPGIQFQKINIDTFDKASALAYLNALGVENTTLAESIFKQFGGNPLTLQLAADIATKEKLSGKSKIDNVTTSKLFGKIDEKRIQEQLIKRNLEHIHNEQVRKVAVPGVLVRKINADIIKSVLAEPCGLTHLSDNEAFILFDELKKESFLITDTIDGIAFRQDLRIALYDLIESDKNYKAKEIHKAALKYYKDKKEPSDIAEYIYHWLKSEENLTAINTLYTPEVGVYLNYSLPEFSSNAFVHLATLTGLTVPEDKLKEVNQDVWERYMQNEIDTILKKGDVDSLLILSKKISLRKNRTFSKLFSLFVSKVYERLGDFKKIEDILTSVNPYKSEYVELMRLDGSLHDVEFNVLYFQQLLNYIEYSANNRIEYNKSIRKELIEQLVFEFPKFYNSLLKYRKTSFFDFTKYLLQLGIAYMRLSKRLDFKADLSISKGVKIAFEKFEEKDINAVLSPIFCKRKQLSIDEFNRYYVKIQVENKFKSQIELLHKSVSDHKAIEQFLKTKYDIHLKDICQPGIFEINLVDTAIFIELEETFRRKYK